MKIKLVDNRQIKLLVLFLCIVFCSILLKVQVGAADPQIKIDVNNVLADVSNRPVGMNLNFLLDKTDVADKSRNFQLGSLRYPMGEIADYYLFDPSNPKSPKISVKDSKLWFSKFTNTGGSWKDPLDFDNFVSVCRSLNAEPFVVIGIDAIAYTGNANHATPEEVLQSATDWVRYANVTKKYNIKHWEIGNETDLLGTDLNWTAQSYANTVVQFSRAMKKVDPSIEIGVNGMSGDAWWNKVMPVVKNDVDFLVTHQYSSMQTYEEWNSNDWNYTYNIEVANKAIETYNPSLRIDVTENSSFNPNKSHQNNVWKMLHNFEMLGNTLSFNKVDYVHFWISQWFAIDPYSTNANVFNSDYELMPMAYPLRIWGNFIKKQMVFSTKAAGKVRSWASYDPDDGSLNLFLLNKDKDYQKLTVDLQNYAPLTQTERWILSGKSSESATPVWKQYPTSYEVKNSKIYPNLLPFSLTVVSFHK